ncbi:hypothetical protein M2124_002194, partial [Polynucleobacter sphagniphilus]|nr:hypothetical protein [Polynucleobacter sphagniphilus]
FVYGYLDQQQWDAGLEKTINPKNTV